MIRGPGELLRHYALYLFICISYTAAFVWILLYLHASIRGATLPAAFLSYNLVGAVWLVWRHKGRHIGQLCLAAVITVAAFLALTALFARTYDVSYDGMYYHEPAIIALDHGWNPVYQPLPGMQPPVTQTFALQLVEGSPKTIWSIEASIAQTTNNLNAATCLNAILAFIAFVFVYTVLRSLGARRNGAIILALLVCAVEATTDEVFSFREDGISYYCVLVAASSLYMLLKTIKDRLAYFWCLAAALVLLVGAKLSNLFLLAPLLLLITYVVVRNRWHTQKAFRISLCASVFLAGITLYNPYVTNWRYYRAIDYPYNLASVSAPSEQAAIPQNLQGDNRLELLFYGIFSRVNDKDATAPGGNDRLKIPFSISGPELDAESDTAAKPSGGYGLLFSGVLVFSLALYGYLAVLRKRTARSTVLWLSVAGMVIFVGALLIPAPNYGRYTPEIELIPVLVAIAWAVIRCNGITFPGATVLWRASVLLIACNVLLGVLLVGARDKAQFHDLNQQLSQLKSPRAVYAVNSPIFYANYELLEQHGVKLRVVPSALKCHGKIQVLHDSRDTTRLCKL